MHLSSTGPMRAPPVPGVHPAPAPTRPWPDTTCTTSDYGLGGVKPLKCTLFWRKCSKYGRFGILIGSHGSIITNWPFIDFLTGALAIT